MVNDLVHGSAGRNIKVKANCFRITNLPTMKFFQYHLEIVPDIERNVVRRLEVFFAMQEQHAEVFRIRAVFDGMANAYSSYDNLDRQYEVRFGTSKTRPPKIFTVVLKMVKMINPLRLNESFKNKQEQVSDILTMLQVFIRQAVATRLIYPPTSKTVYHPIGSRPLPCGLEIWRGIFQSVRPGPDHLFINVDASWGVMYESGKLIEVARRSFGRDNRNIGRDARDLAMIKPGSQEWNHLKSFLKGLKVSVRMFPEKRSRAIVDIVPRAGHFEFEYNDEEITVGEYFHRTHNTTLQLPNMFGVVLSKTRKDVVPAEFCEVVPGQIYKKRVLPEVTPDMMKAVDIKPQQRLDLICDAVGSKQTILDYANSDFMNNVGMRVDTKPLDLEGRALQAPKIGFASGPVLPKNGSWNVVNHQLFKPGYLLCWAVVVFEPKVDQGLLRSVIQGLRESLRNLGVKQYVPGTVGSPIEPTMATGWGQNVETVLENVQRSMNIDELWNQYNTDSKKDGRGFLPSPPTPLIIVILPDSAAQIRQAVKHWSDTKTGIATQCMRNNKLRLAKNQYCNNVSLKINARLGGINSTANDVWMKKLSEKPTMVVAADVGHPGPGVIQRPSMTSLVASFDQNFTRYSAFSSVQNPRTEIIEKLDEMMFNALKNFGDCNTRPAPDPKSRPIPIVPQRIVFYRDGVSEGEYQKIVDFEIPKIESAIKKVWAMVPGGPPPMPTLTLIIVGKRHHIRFFPADSHTMEDQRTGNCPAGLVVDQVVNNIHGNYFDFYLQSQGGLKGTSRPSHYVVVRHDPEMNADYLQGISYALCHIHARATRSVGIPAPVYYADLVCSRVEYHFKDMYYEATAQSGGSEFDLKRWQDNFIPSKRHTAMYFM